jgi:hypothetical protein
MIYGELDDHLVAISTQTQGEKVRLATDTR